VTDTPRATRSSSAPVRALPSYRPLLAVTLWCMGLLVALMLGMLSAYLVVSGLFIGSKVFARLRARSADRS
jgi:hypothetical protein